jgi:NADH-quinone oxidoreductase subunit C
VTDNTQDPSHDVESRVPAERGAVESMGTRHGMFGVSGTGDTSGYGGLVKQTVFPGASQRPYGGWYDEVADALEARL